MQTAASAFASAAPSNATSTTAPLIRRSSVEFSATGVFLPRCGVANIAPKRGQGVEAAARRLEHVGRYATPLPVRSGCRQMRTRRRNQVEVDATTPLVRMTE